MSLDIRGVFQIRSPNSTNFQGSWFYGTAFLKEGVELRFFRQLGFYLTLDLVLGSTILQQA